MEDEDVPSTMVEAEYAGPLGIRGYGAKVTKRLKPPTLREQLTERRVYLTKEIETIDKALEQLDKLPGVEDLMNTLNSLGVR